MCAANNNNQTANMEDISSAQQEFVSLYKEYVDSGKQVLMASKFWSSFYALYKATFLVSNVEKWCEACVNTSYSQADPLSVLEFLGGSILDSDSMCEIMMSQYSGEVIDSHLLRCVFMMYETLFTLSRRIMRVASGVQERSLASGRGRLSEKQLFVVHSTMTVALGYENLGKRDRNMFLGMMDEKIGQQALMEILSYE